MIGEQAILREPAPAKLNLSLKIVGRRPDGYHLLDSLVAFTEAADLLELVPSAGLTLTVEGPFAESVPTSDDNLVLRAALLLGRVFDRQPSVTFRLEKNLPAAAGIGGGSADAAAALRLLARHWSIDIGDPRVHEAALQLGADVPVCLQSRRSQMSGIGELVTPIAGEPPCAVLLINPGIELSTAQVFARYSASTSTGSGLETTENDLMAPAVDLVPEIAEVLAFLRSVDGCATCGMSGSGPTCFGFFGDENQANAAADMARRHRPSWWSLSTLLLD